MKIKEMMNEAKSEIKGELNAAYKGIGALGSIIGWIITIFLVIGFFTGTLGNVVDNLFLKPYYIYETKTIDSPTGIGTLKDYVNSNFTNVEWGFERLDDTKYVTISGDESGSTWKFYYKIEDGYITFENLTADEQPISDYVDNKVNSLLSDDTDIVYEDESQTQEQIPEGYGLYKPNELGQQYRTYIDIDNMKDKYDDEELKELVLESKINGNKIEKVINNYLEDPNYFIQHATKASTVRIKGYSEQAGTDMLLEFTVSNTGDVYLSDIRHGANNTFIDLENQIKIAESLFN